MSEAYKSYECIVCEMVYSEEKGLPEQGIAPGTKWEDLSEDFECPDCGVSKEDFSLIQ
jgi:rubredoxin